MDTCGREFWLRQEGSQEICITLGLHKHQGPVGACKSMNILVPGKCDLILKA